jgi:hypothetical protein
MGKEREVRFFEEALLEFSITPFLCDERWFFHDQRENELPKVNGHNDSDRRAPELTNDPFDLRQTYWRSNCPGKKSSKYSRSDSSATRRANVICASFAPINRGEANDPFVLRQTYWRSHCPRLEVIDVQYK